MRRTVLPPAVLYSGVWAPMLRLGKPWWGRRPAVKRWDDDHYFGVNRGVTARSIKMGGAFFEHFSRDLHPARMRRCGGCPRCGGDLLEKREPFCLQCGWDEDEVGSNVRSAESGDDL